MKRRGLALSIVLLMMTVLLILAITLIALSRRQTLSVLDYQRETLAVHAAEAGLARALKNLQMHSDWNQGFDREPLLGGEATYSVHFTTSTPFGSEDSFHNLLGTTPVQGVRGSVPPGCIWLTSIGRSGTSARTIDAILSRPGLPGLSAGLLGTGRIRLRGQLSIDGQDTPQSPPGPGDLHSNFQGATGEPSISWEPLAPGDRADIAGDATSSDGRPVDDTVVFAGPNSLHDRLSSQPVRSLGSFDIPQMIAAAQAESIRPTLVAGGETVLDGGRYTLDSVPSHTGDIVLKNGAELYVTGDFQLEGALRGTGTLVVGGNTVLRGDVDVSARGGVALLSEGDVNLEGYQAKEYLDGIPAAQPLVSGIQDTLSDMVNALASGDPAVLGQLGTLDCLNHHMNSAGSFCPLAVPSREAVLIPRLLQVLRDQPADPRRDFLIRKVERMERFFDHGATDAEKRGYVQAFVAEPSLGCTKVLESLSDVGLDMLASGEIDPATLRTALQNAAHIARENRLDRLTSSYFQGLIYTHGNVHATGEVVIIGALVADGRGEKGNLTLDGGTSVTFLKSLFEGDERLTLPGTLGIQAWALR